MHLFIYSFMHIGMYIQHIFWNVYYVPGIVLGYGRIQNQFRISSFKELSGYYIYNKVLTIV